MDGNGRWAKKRCNRASSGHKAGMEALQEVTLQLKIWGFFVSWTGLCLFLRKTGRPEDDSSSLLAGRVYDRFVPGLHRNNVKIQMIGDPKLPKKR